MLETRLVLSDEEERRYKALSEHEITHKEIYVAGLKAKENEVAAKAKETENV